MSLNANVFCKVDKSLNLTAKTNVQRSCSCTGSFGRFQFCWGFLFCFCLEDPETHDRWKRLRKAILSDDCLPWIILHFPWLQTSLAIIPPLLKTSVLPAGLGHGVHSKAEPAKTGCRAERGREGRWLSSNLAQQTVPRGLSQEPPFRIPTSAVLQHSRGKRYCFFAWKGNIFWGVHSYEVKRSCKGQLGSFKSKRDVPKGWNRACKVKNLWHRPARPYCGRSNLPLASFQVQPCSTDPVGQVCVPTRAG